MKAKTISTGTTRGESAVTWDRATVSYGRNRDIKTKGVNLSLTHYPKGAKHIPAQVVGNGDLTLSVITSRGQVSHNCWIELPADPRVLLQLAQELKDAATAIEDGKQGNLPKA
jgi:hypothetical protein